ncbi:MAG TPA: biotin--[acetyl-CoA-carboxylase] ligase, partial [Terriglobales bacterium]|nr:biotin--[acetyl-CoA-carboxylase] ligase [Terriglobales bacterium]
EEGTLFVAETQTAGRGRHGHQWVSPAGVGLYASLLLRPRRPAAALLLLTLAAGLAVAEAVEAETGLHADIRWPNDLLLADKKFCGLLIESAPEPAGLIAVLGFGINLRPAAFPPELAAIATALDLHTAKPVAREPLLAAVLAAIERRYRDWCRGDDADAALRREFESRSRYARGLSVTVEGAWSGMTAGLDPSGFLLVRTPAGELRTVISGDVRPSTGGC